MSARSDVLVVGGGPVGACAAQALAADGASVTLIEKEAEVCPPVSGAHANCGLLVPSDVTPLAAPGALGQGLRWMLDSSSPFYLSLIHISEPTRLGMISYAVFCLKKKKQKQ